MEQKIIEGTWEEVTRRGQELAGHRVRVTVLDDVILPRATNGNHPDEATEPTAFDVLSRARLIGSLKGNPDDLAGRSPGPFLEDEAGGAPVDLPRPGPIASRSCIWDQVRHPDLALGE